MFPLIIMFPLFRFLIRNREENINQSIRAKNDVSDVIDVISSQIRGYDEDNNSDKNDIIS